MVGRKRADPGGCGLPGEVGLLMSGYFVESPGSFDISARWADSPEWVPATLTLEEFRPYLRNRWDCAAGAIDEEDSDPQRDTCELWYTLRFGLMTSDGRMDTLHITRPSYAAYQGLVVAMSSTDWTNALDPLIDAAPDRDLLLRPDLLNPTGCWPGVLWIARDPTAPYGDPEAPDSYWFNQDCLPP